MNDTSRGGMEKYISDPILHGFLTEEYPDVSTRFVEHEYSCPGFDVWRVKGMWVKPQKNLDQYVEFSDMHNLVTFDEEYDAENFEKISEKNLVHFKAVGNSVAIVTGPSALAFIVTCMFTSSMLFLLGVPAIFAVALLLTVLRNFSDYQKSIADNLRSAKTRKRIPDQSSYFAINTAKTGNIVSLLKKANNNTFFMEIVRIKLKTVESRSDLREWIESARHIIEMEPSFPLDTIPVLLTDIRVVHDALEKKDKIRKAEQKEIDSVGESLNNDWLVMDSESSKNQALAHIEGL